MSLTGSSFCPRAPPVSSSGRAERYGYPKRDPVRLQTPVDNPIPSYWDIYGNTRRRRSVLQPCKHFAKMTCAACEGTKRDDGSFIAPWSDERIRPCEEPLRPSAAKRIGKPLGT